MFDSLRTVRGIVRSLRIYYGDRQHGPAMQRLYSQFVQPGDLVFDIGAHVGDRIAAFRRLNARVVAVEPQPALARTLRLIYGRDPKVTIEEAAVGRQAGHVELNLNIDNPTVSTASDGFHRRGRWCARLARPRLAQALARTAHDHRRIDRAAWHACFHQDRRRRVRGRSACRAEAACQRAFVRIHPDPARSRASPASSAAPRLAIRQFNAALGESQTLVHPDWIDAGAILRWLEGLPPEANSGDIYARLG